MRKLVVFFLVIVLFISNVSFKVYAKDNEPSVAADGAVLMDAETGTILYSKNADNSYPPASTTKLMTALLTLENTKLDDVVTVGKNPPLADGSKIYLYEGEEIKVKDLMYALLLASANDCAEALAEHISGSTENFAELMNKRAKELGCEDTNFVNPSGLYNENHKTSAKDLALIMRELQKHPEYKEIATTQAYKIAPTNKQKDVRPVWNENRLIQKGTSQYYEGCEGGKTGYTVQSAHSYVASATRNGQRLIVALIHDKEKMFFSDAINLFNYGFNNFDLVRVYSKGDEVSKYTDNDLNIPLLAANDFYFVRKKGTNDTPVIKPKKVNLSDVYFKSGDVVSEASAKLHDKDLGTIKLTSGVDHESKKPIAVAASIEKINNNTLYAASLIIILLLLAITILRRRKKLRKNKYASKYHYD